MLTKLDSTLLKDAVVKALVACHGADEASLDGIKVWAQWVSPVKDERYYEPIVVINPEGVGYTSDEMGRVTILYFTEGFASSGWIDIHKSIVMSCATDEQDDLADIIRTFGDRLETNFDIWHSKLSK